MFFDAKTKYYLHDGISFSRKEPYIMLANHTFLFDVIHVPLRFKKVPYIVASQTLFTKQPTKFLLTKVAHAIPKSKGTSDIRTAKMLISSIKKGYPLLIFPEGNTTFNGETNYIEESTYKLIKKLKVDVITCTVSGGYLSKPRWALGKRKNRRIEMHYRKAIKKEDLKSMSLEDIQSVIKETLYNNDYEYQRQAMIKHPGKELAKGLENFAYVCPECQAINSIETSGNSIRCNKCDTLGEIDSYGFIKGFKFDNLIDWDQYQKDFKSDLLESTFSTSGEILYADYETGLRDKIGHVTMTYKEHSFIFSGDLELSMPLEEVKNPTITLRRNFNFMFRDKAYVVKLEGYVFSFLRVAQNKY
jgi:1-acyl-sn-glycerol-3-phosphate acyltransferase